MNTNDNRIEAEPAAVSRKEFSIDVDKIGHGLGVRGDTESVADADENHDAVTGPSDLENLLEREARMFAARAKNSDAGRQTPLRLIVADFEYAYDRGSYAGYLVSEGKDGRHDIRWPFHHIATASWMVLRFDPQADVPIVEDFAVIANDEADERAIAVRFFEALRHYPCASLATWAGEFKDLAVLRRCASEFGMLLPHQLRDLNPHARERIDLCQAVTGKAKPVHLPEYAMGTGIPCKPSPSKDVGPLVEQGKWMMVRDQCLADVLTTSVILLRHLFSQGIITCHLQRSQAALADAAGTAVPTSPFVHRSFAPWVRGELAASRLKGVVHRAA